MFSSLTRFLMLFVSLVIYSVAAYSNNLRITNITKTAYNKVRFNVSWDNSWSVAGYPSNHDAVWLFVKYYDCPVAGATGTWKHAKLSTNMASHSFSGVEAAKPILEVNRLGSGTGHNTGVLIRRIGYGTGNILDAVCELELADGQLDQTKRYEFKVFGLEMVQVPEGAYYLGDSLSDSAFKRNFDVEADRTPVKVRTNETLTIKVNGVSTPIVIPANYPKGYEEFYCMKYEITCGDYVAFLNTITKTQSEALKVAANRTYRTNITVENNVYSTARPTRAMNFLDWKKIAAFLDWSALRPMTELEYEKGCRGFNDPVKGEISSGTNNIRDYVKLPKTISTKENGNEVIEEKNASVNVQTIYASEPGSSNQLTYQRSKFIGGDGENGPLRVGIFANSTSKERTETGATFFGMLDMSGNVAEIVITAHTSIVNTYTGDWGDGILEDDGDYNTSGWPVLTNITTPPYQVGCRGGSYENFAATNLDTENGKHAYKTSRNDNTINVSHRNECVHYILGSHNYRTGGRGVR